MQLLSCGRAGTVRDKVLVTIQALVEHVQILLRVLSGCNPIKRELLGLGEEGGAGPGMLQSCLSHTMAMSPLAIKSQHRFGTRTGGEGSPWPGEAQEAPDSARRTHGQRRARPGLAATRETKQKPSLAPGVQQTQSTTGNTPVPRSSMLGWRRIQPPWQGAPLPHKPGDIRAPSRHPLSLPPPLVPQTLISHLMAP